MKKKNKWVLLLIICLGGSVIFIFPYLQYTFYDAMMEKFNFNNTQMGSLISVYGALNLVAYFLGGFIADRFESRKLIALSLVITGLTGFWFATFPSYGVMMLISVIWSISTIFMYWAAVIKAVKMLGDEDVQGRLFGFREALNSFGSLIFSSIALWIFSKSGENIQTVVIFYSFVYIAAGILSFLLLPKMEGNKDENRQPLFEGISYVLKSPTVWLIGFIIFFGYGIGTTMGRLAPYLTSVFKMGAVTAGIIGVINTYGIPNVGAVAGGLIADKMKSSTKFLMWCFAIMAFLLLFFIFIPGKASWLVAAIIMGLSVRLVQTAVRGTYFVPLSESKIPDKYLGTAAGVVSVIGFLPDAFLLTLYGKVLDSVPGETGYKIMFGSLIGFCAIGFILTLFLLKKLKKNNPAQTEEITAPVEK